MAGRRRVGGLLIAIAAVGASLAPVARAQLMDPTAACPVTQALVKVRDGTDPAAVVARQGGVIVETIPAIEVQVVAVPSGSLSQVLADFQADPDVMFAEANGVMSSPERSVGQPSSETSAPCPVPPPPR